MSPPLARWREDPTLASTTAASLPRAAPAPGRGHLAAAVEGAGSIAVPVLLLVDASDSSVILEGFEMLERALRKHRKDLKAVRYDRGGGHRLFWKVGYYWKDVREFLTEKLAEGPPR